MEDYFDLLKENGELRLQVLKLEDENDRLKTRIKMAKEMLGQ